jgi:hypothetical protein
MSKNHLLFCLAGVASLQFFAQQAFCEKKDGGLDTKDLAYRSKRSDCVVHVNVLNVQSVGKKTKIEDGKIIADVLSYGRLVTVRPISNLWRRLDAFMLPEQLYIFQQGASPSLEQARLKKNTEYILFLKEQATPGIVTAGLETSPYMPLSNYYSIVDMRWGSIPANDTAGVSRIKAHFQSNK